MLFFLGYFQQRFQYVPWIYSLFAYLNGARWKSWGINKKFEYYQCILSEVADLTSVN